MYKKCLWFFLFAPISCLAAWTGSGEIRTVYSHNGSIIVVTDLPDNACGSAGKFWWPTSDSDSKDMLSLALTAFAGSYKASFVIPDTPTSGQCLHGGVQATHIAVSK